MWARGAQRDSELSLIGNQLSRLGLHSQLLCEGFDLFEQEIPPQLLRHRGQG